MSLASHSSGSNSHANSSSNTSKPKYKSERVLCVLLFAMFFLFLALCSLSVRVLRSHGRQQEAAAASGANEGVMSFVNLHFWQEDNQDKDNAEKDKKNKVGLDSYSRSAARADSEVRSSYSFVEGEKRLKQELRKLLEHQEKGHCLGVKIRTLWKGEDVPVWECEELGITNLGPLHPVEQEQPHESRSTKNVTYPSPAQKAHPQATVLMQPTYGQHRHNVDAVFAFAEGYPLSDFIYFITTLRQTGFDGDVVLSVSSPQLLNPKVDAYLKAQEHIVVYSVTWNCFKKSGEQVGSPGPERDCNLLGMYGIQGQTEALQDPRKPRPLATARFELYWAWSLRYDADRLLLLVDFRDTFFQRNPFVGITRSKNLDLDGGVIYAFEENAQTNVGQSSFNARWITRAYGKPTLDKMKHYNIICSGSTMGDQYAIQIYLRAMVAQYDTTQCTQKGCDQGMHNYLLREAGLGETTVGIQKVLFVEQGKGNVNNLGVLRNKSLREWGLLTDKDGENDGGGDEIVIVNWDKSVSPVVHQYDRDEELKRYVKKRQAVLEKKWLSSK